MDSALWVSLNDLLWIYDVCVLSGSHQFSHSVVLPEEQAEHLPDQVRVFNGSLRAPPDDGLNKNFPEFFFRSFYPDFFSVSFAVSASTSGVFQGLKV